MRIDLGAPVSDESDATFSLFTGAVCSGCGKSRGRNAAEHVSGACQRVLKSLSRVTRPLHPLRDTPGAFSCDLADSANRGTLPTDRLSRRCVQTAWRPGICSRSAVSFGELRSFGARFVCLSTFAWVASCPTCRKKAGVIIEQKAHLLL